MRHQIPTWLRSHSTRRPRPSRLHAQTSNRQNTSCFRSASAVAYASEPSSTSQAITTSFPSTQPPSYKPPELRKTQLLRQYTSLLRSTSLLLLFQHNNLKSNEWMSIRRELTKALRKVDQEHQTPGVADAVKVTVVHAGLFEAALKLVEIYFPMMEAEAQKRKDEAAAASGEQVTAGQDPDTAMLGQSLSAKAHKITSKHRLKSELAPLISGPVAIMTFPTVSPQHLKAALSILAPVAPAFRAPTRRANPAYYEPNVQNGLQKLMLLGARCEGRVFDGDGTRWIGGIEAGLDGLRAQLVAILQGVGSGLASTLEGAGRNLYFTMEQRKQMLEPKDAPEEDVKDG